MTCKELLQEGVCNNWYFVSALSGEFQIKFAPKPPFTQVDESIPVFSIKDMNISQDKVRVLENMFRYAAVKNIEYLQFENDGGVLDVLIDILETR